MSKSEAKASSLKKRKHAEVEDNTTNAIASSSTSSAAKKAKKGDKKNGDKKKSKSHKERKAEAAEALNAQEYDLEDVAMADVKDDGEEKAEEKKKSSKKEKKEGKKSKKEKKAEKAEKNTAAATATATNTEGEDQVIEESKDKSKSKSKDKKTKKDKKDKSNGSKEDVTADETGREQQQADASAEVEAQNGAEEGYAGKNSRFICFVGNLPYSATKADIANHFASLKPSSIRLLTERNAPTKSRGIAFVEFDNYSHMKTCLAKFHHTEMLDPKTQQPRRINVELTAGGGGKTKGRMDKLAEKNQKLNEERARRIAKEEAEKLENAKLKKEKDGKGNGAKMEDHREEVYVHPSRRAHVPGKRS